MPAWKPPTVGWCPTELVQRSAVFQGDGFLIRTAALEDIINAKERAGRPKDREALPELREIAERERRESPDAPET